jgi:anti-sigma B factor antagonist
MSSTEPPAQDAMPLATARRTCRCAASIGMRVVIISDTSGTSLGALHYTNFVMGMPDPGLAIGTRSVDHWTVIEVRGDVDLATTPQFREALSEASAGGESIAVDLRGVPFMDSMGLGVLVGARRRAGESGADLALICSDGPIVRLLEVSGLSTMFRVVPDEGDL